MLLVVGHVVERDAPLCGCCWKHHRRRHSSMNSGFLRFKKAMESVVTARNQLLDAYRHVRCDFYLRLLPLSWVVEAAMIIDPFWDVKNLATKHSKKFRDLFEYLARNQPMDPNEEEEVPKLEALNERDEKRSMPSVQLSEDKRLQIMFRIFSRMNDTPFTAFSYLL